MLRTRGNGAQSGYPKTIDATDDKSVESTASSDDETELRVIEQVRAEFETAKRPFETVQATGSKVVVVFKSVSAVDDVLAEYEMLDTYKVNDWITLPIFTPFLLAQEVPSNINM